MNGYNVNQFGVIVYKAYKPGTAGNLIAVNKEMLQSGKWGETGNAYIVTISNSPVSFIKNTTLGSRLITEMTRKY